MHRGLIFRKFCIFVLQENTIGYVILLYNINVNITLTLHNY